MTDVSRRFFFFNDTATTEIYTLSLHDALPILLLLVAPGVAAQGQRPVERAAGLLREGKVAEAERQLASVLKGRSEEHTSELQSRQYLVCRLLLEKKKHNLTSVMSRQH